jgi:UDP-glucose 4-epimerase
LCLRLVELGLSVRALDAARPGLGYRPFHRERLAGRVEWQDGDLAEAPVASAAVDGVAVVFHLAGHGSHAGSMADPLADLRDNLLATEALLEALRAAPTRPRLVFGSTRQLYGRNPASPVPETAPVRIVDVNAVHKAAAEEMIRLYHRVHDLPGVILRLTNVCGPGMRIQDARQGFTGGWLRALLENRPFEIWGGTQVRDLLHPDDAAEAFVLAGWAPTAPGETYNVASGHGVALRDLADQLIAAWGAGSYTVRELPEAQRRIDIGDFVADVRKAARDLGWRPRHDLPSLLADTAAYYRAHAAHYLD